MNGSLFVLFLCLSFGNSTSSSSSSSAKERAGGLLKMCPPGGESFTTAWQITCGMRRRRRDIQKRNLEYRPLSLTEMMSFCCQFGCSFRDLMPYCDPFGQWDS